MLWFSSRPATVRKCSPGVTVQSSEEKCSHESRAKIMFRTTALVLCHAGFIMSVILCLYWVKSSLRAKKENNADRVILKYHNGCFSRQKVLFVHLIDGCKLLGPYPRLSTTLWHHSSQGHMIALQDSFLSKGCPPWSCCFEIKLAIVIFTAHDKDKGTGQRGHTHSL